MKRNTFLEYIIIKIKTEIFINIKRLTFICQPFSFFQ